MPYARGWLHQFLFYVNLLGMLTAEENNIDQALKDMFLNGMHYGYSATSRHPKMKPYIFGLRNGVEIFDLEKTKACLDKAKEFVRNSGKDRKTILFVGTKKEAKGAAEKFARELNMPFVSERWIGGTLTNFKNIKARIDHLNDMKKKRDTGELDKYTKKEKLNIERKIQKMEKYFGGISEFFKGMPAAIVVVDPKHERISVEEAVMMRVPVIAIINSDCDPKGVNYPVPANDNSSLSINFFLSEIAGAYKEGTLLTRELEPAGKEETVKS